MRHSRTATILAAVAIGAPPALAQEMAEEEIGRADEAAGTMMGQVYVQQPTTGITPAEVIAALRERGYTNIHDFDVEWDEYEVEATSPAGENVEIEIDPATGRVKDIDPDFF